MRLKPGRPDIGRYAARFDVPAASGELGVTFLGVSTLLLSDGTSSVMTDGFFSRPGLVSVGLGRIAPSEARIEAALSRAGVERLDAVVPVHSHYDHALDSAVVASRTDAVLVGGASTVQIGLGGGLPVDRIQQVSGGSTVTHGSWTLTFAVSDHCPPDRYPGVITAPVVPPVRTAAYKCGEAWSIHVAHASGRTLLVQGSAGFVPGAVDGWRAEIVYLGIGQLGVRPDDYIESYWRETVTAVGAKRVVVTHWDDFFRSLDQPLRALPYAGDDLDRAIRIIDRLAARDGVRVSFPTVWRRENPWA